jgi:hypothetical protein
LSTHTFYVNRDNVLTDVYLSSISKATRGGFADFLTLESVDEVAMKAFYVMMGSDKV